MNVLKLNRWFLLPLVLVAVMAVGCSDDDDNPTTPTAATAQLRVAHLSPDAPAVDVWVDGARVPALTNVPFEAVSAYLELAAGSYRVQVTPHGVETPVVIDETVDLAAGSWTTAAAVGLLDDSSIALRSFADDVSTTEGQARVRFLHASPDAPAVDITLIDGTVLFGNVAFGEASEAYGSVPAGAYDLQVRLAGSETVVLSFGDVAVDGGTTYTVIAKGLVGDGSLGAQVQVDAPGDGGTTAPLSPATAALRVAHLSPDAPAVDVWLNGEIVSGLTNVPFPAVSAYLTVPAATAQVQVFVTGTSSDPVLDLAVTPLPGRAYTAAATGLVGQSDLQALLLEDDRSPLAGQAQVRFVHASPDAPAVDVAVADGGPTLFGAVSFREAQGYGAVAPATYDLEVLVASNKAQALAVPGVQLQAGVNYTIFAIGLAGDGSLAALPAVDTP